MSVGRWLYRSHPAAVSPEQWDEDLALEYVSVVCAGHIGEDISASAAAVLGQKGLLGKPFSPGPLTVNWESCAGSFAICKSARTP
jgi:hypothetical protein